jgi:hypothetical protein
VARAETPDDKCKENRKENRKENHYAKEKDRKKIAVIAVGIIDAVLWQPLLLSISV